MIMCAFRGPPSHEVRARPRTYRLGDHARRAGALLLSAMKQTKNGHPEGWPFSIVFLAERGGFEPPIGYEPIHAFQACDLNHSSISPDGVSCVHEAAYYNKVSLLYKPVPATITRKPLPATSGATAAAPAAPGSPACRRPLRRPVRAASGAAAPPAPPTLTAPS